MQQKYKPSMVRLLRALKKEGPVKTFKNAKAAIAYLYRARPTRRHGQGAPTAK